MTSGNSLEELRAEETEPLTFRFLKPSHLQLIIFSIPYSFLGKEMRKNEVRATFSQRPEFQASKLRLNKTRSATSWDEFIPADWEEIIVNSVCFLSTSSKPHEMESFLNTALRTERLSLSENLSSQCLAVRN